MRDMSFLRVLFLNISSKRIWQLLFVLLFAVIGVITEISSFALIVPFLSILADASLFDEYPFIGEVVNSLGFEENPYLGLAVITSVVVLISGILRILLEFSINKVVFGIGVDISDLVFKNILLQNYLWHLSINSSEIIAVFDKIGNVVSGIILPIVNALASLLIIVGLVGILLYFETQLVIISGIVIFLMYLIFGLSLEKRLNRNGQIIAKKSIYEIQTVQESLGLIRDIIIERNQEFFSRKFNSLISKKANAIIENNVLMNFPRNIIESIGIILIVVFISYLHQSGSLLNKISVIAALAIAAQRLLPHFQQIYRSWSSVKGNLSHLKDVIFFLNNSLNVPNFESNRTMRDNSFNKKNDLIIKLNNVSYSYKGSEKLVLDDVNIEIKNGSKIGIVGESGSGKSTLVDIILGLLQPSKGSIEIYGNQLNIKNSHQWRNMISHVPQFVFLIDSSIKSNIAVGIKEEDIDLERIKEVASLANISKKIENLPNKYNTYVGERGSGFSGGEIQRIGIARSLYKNKEVLIFDEATSSLDKETEKEVIKLIDSIKLKRTQIIISHKKEILKNCDVIYEVKNKKVKAIKLSTNS